MLRPGSWIEGTASAQIGTLPGHDLPAPDPQSSRLGALQDSPLTLGLATLLHPLCTPSSPGHHPSCPQPTKVSLLGGTVQTGTVWPAGEVLIVTQDTGTGRGDEDQESLEAPLSMTGTQ